MTDLAKLTVKLEAQTAKYQAELEKANNKLDRFEKKTRSSIDGIKTAFVTLAASAGLVAFTKRTLDSADALNKLSVRVGVSAERIQELNFAFSQSGVSASTVESSLQRFGARLGEAANGGGEAKDALAGLGVEIRNSDGALRDVNSVFTEALNKLGQVEDVTLRNAAAMDLFGREGIKLTQVGKNLDSLSQKARDLGIVIDGSTLKSAEDLNDQLDIMARVVQARLAPAILTLASWASQAAVSFTDFGEALGKTFAEMMHGSDDPLIRMGDELERLKEQRESLQRTLEAYPSGDSRYKTVVDATTASIDRLTTSIKSLEKAKEQALQDKATAQAGRAIKTPTAPITPIVLPGSTDDPEKAKPTPAAKAELNPDDVTRANFESIRQSLASREQLENESYLRRLEQIQMFAELSVSNEQTANMAAMAEHERHQAAITSIIENETQKRLALANAERQAKISALGDTFSAMSSLMNTGSKKLFKIGKAFAISSAIIDGYKAIQNAYANAPFPFNIAAAAAMAVRTAVQVQNIKKQQFGGGGTVSAAGGAPNVYQPPQPSIPDQKFNQPSGTSQSPTFVFNGDVNGINEEHLAELLTKAYNRDFINTNIVNG